MFGDRLILLALVLGVASASTNGVPYCSLSLSREEWQKEGESYLLNVRQLEQHLQAEYAYSK